MSKIFGVIRKIADVAVGMLCLILVALVAISFFSEQFYIAEVLVHLRLLFSILLAVGLLVVVAMKKRVFVVVCLVAMLCNAVPVLALYVPAEGGVGRRDGLTIVNANLWGGKNKHFEAAARMLVSEKPNIIMLSEVTVAWKRRLDGLLSEYPYRMAETKYGGVAIYSKLPLKDTKVFYVGTIHRPGIHATVEWNGRDIELLNVHTATPFKFAWRNEELNDMAERADDAGEMLVLGGDLNCSPWSSYFEKLLVKGRLQDTEQGFGAWPTWSTHYLLPLIPIDHCLTRGFRCTERKVLGKIGSDHLPVLVRLVAQ